MTVYTIKDIEVGDTIVRENGSKGVVTRFVDVYGDGLRPYATWDSHNGAELHISVSSIVEVIKVKKPKMKYKTLVQIEEAQAKGAVFAYKGYSPGPWILKGCDPSHFTLIKDVPEPEIKPKMTPHVHAELIKLWADGAKIQYKSTSDTPWYDVTNNKPLWETTRQYRVKPEKPETFTTKVIHNYEGKKLPDGLSISLVYSDETQEIISVEIVKD